MLRARQWTIDGGSHVGEGLQTGAVPEAGGVVMGEQFDGPLTGKSGRTGSFQRKIGGAADIAKGSRKP